MDERFDGVMALPDGDRVRVELLVSSAALEVRSGGTEIGAWPLKYCRVSRLDSEEFELSVDGERVEFWPNEPERFGLLAARRVEATSLADRINVIRAIPATDPAEPETGQRPRGLAPRRVSRTAVAGGLLVAAGLLAAGLTFISGEPVVTDRSVQGTTTTVSVASPDPFGHAPAVFVEAWNRTADEFDAPVRIRQQVTTGPFEVEVTPRMMLQGTTGVDGTLASLVFTADPAGGPSEDQLIIAAWGVALAVVDPDLDAAGRRALLTELGLDLDELDLTGLEGEVERGVIVYSLRYIDAFGSILFTISE